VPALRFTLCLTGSIVIFGGGCTSAEDAQQGTAGSYTSAGAGASSGGVGITGGTGGASAGAAGDAPAGNGGTQSTAGTSGSPSAGAPATGGSAGLAGSGGEAPFEPDAGNPAPTSSFVYVSGYAPPISVFTLDHATGELTPGDMTDTGTGGEPTFIAFSPNKQFAYAIDEQLNGPMARVIAFSIDSATGALTEINRQNTGTSVNAHVAVHDSGQWVLSANYGGGSVTVFPVRPDGGLEAGMTPVPAGGQAHQVAFDSTGTIAFVPCLADGYIAVYDFADGVLSPRDPPTIAIDGGPRFMAFTPDERFAYVLTQNESTITHFEYDGIAGLNPIETIDATSNGASLSAHIEVHESGKFLYASNRDDNSVAVFNIDPVTGSLTSVAEQRDMLNFPRLFAIDPTGQLMVVGSQHGNTVLVHRIDQQTGALSVVGTPVSVPPEPTFVGILAIP